MYGDRKHSIGLWMRVGAGGEIEKVQEQTTVSNESVHCLDSADAFTDMLKLIIVYILNMYSLL